MILSDSIQAVRDAAQIEEVVGHFIDLDKRLGGKCPFHDEKSASFKVSPPRNMYKCFGCGAVGDAIKFVQEYENKTFAEAIEWLAGHYNITLEYDKNAAKIPKKDKVREENLYKVNSAASKHYIQTLLALKDDHPVMLDLKGKRLLDDDILMDWQIGFAPDNSRFITDKVMNIGLYPHAESLGLVLHRDEKNFDFFRKRIMIPIQNLDGRIVGFGGRTIDPNEKAKYFNSYESVLYKKDQILFGLYQATRRNQDADGNKLDSAVKRAGYFFLVEGYFDVIQLHRKGFENTIAQCGTALTEGQAKLLKRYSDRIVLLYDGDETGINKALANLDILLKFNFQVEIIVLPEKKDPDDFCREKSLEEITAFFDSKREDAFTFKANYHLSRASNISERAQAIELISDTATNIANEVKREEYVKALAKKFKIESKLLKTSVKKQLDIKVEQERRRKERELQKQRESQDDDDFMGFLPKGVDRKEFERFGFFEQVDGHRTCYRFHKGKSELETIGNFVLKPLFHVYSKDENNKRLVEINNGFHKEIIEMPSRSLISVEQFASAVFQEGNFVWDGTKIHLMKLLKKIADQFPKCFELKTLGWQPEGFFAFSDVIFSENEIRKFDDMGIAQHADVSYFSPSVSMIYKNVRKDDDEYENDRYLVYRPGKTDFRTWANLFYRVYGEKGMLGIAAVIMALHKDIVFKLDNNCPLVYAYGQKGTGKSKFCESLTSVFLNNLEPFNLNHGTEFAFFNRMARFRNCITWFDELDDKTIRDERRQSLKGSYDGSGRERGRGGSRNRTEISRSNGVNLLSGQYLSTADDNALLSRCIVMAFSKLERNKEDIQFYDKLKAMEAEGLSGIITEILQHRKAFEKHYAKSFGEAFSELRDMVSKDGSLYEERVLRNYTVLLTCLNLFSDKIKLPFDIAAFKNLCKNEVIHLSRLIAESDSLADFWNTLVYLADRKELEYGFDFKIEVRTEVKINIDRKESRVVKFGKPTKLLYLRLENVQKAYARYNAKNVLDISSLKLYFEPLASFIGNNPGSSFKSMNGDSKSTSSYVFDYDKLGVALERIVEPEDLGEPVKIKGTVKKDAVLHDVNGVPVMKFTLETVEHYYHDLLPVRKEILTQCYFKDLSCLAKFAAGVFMELKGILKVQPIGKENDKFELRILDVMEFRKLERLDSSGVDDDLPF